MTRTRAHIFAVLLAALLLPNAAFASGDPRPLFAEGRNLYDAGKFQQAVEIFARAVELQPADSECHRWLGKAYGRLAERAGWIEAIALAKKTRRAFERAVELDGDNAEALTDLMSYYQEAPSFLGGGRHKAERIRVRLAQIRARDS